MKIAGGKDLIQALNPDSLKVVTAYLEPALAQARADEKFQFERHGYFVADRVDHTAGHKLVFNRVTGLKDSWGNKPGGFKFEVQHLPPSKVRRCQAPHPSAINSFSMKTA